MGMQRTLASLKRSYEREGNIALSDSSWYDRFSPELVRFLKTCVIHGIEHLAATEQRHLSEKLKHFQDVLIQDSTIIRLHKMLAKRWPAARSRKVAAGVKDRILLVDLSFYKHHLFTKIGENGGFFVSRLKGTADPMIVDVHSVCRGNSIDVVGQRVSAVLPRLHRQVLDVEVEMPVKRRMYDGRQRKDDVWFRMVAVFNKEENVYHLYLTNIPTDLLIPEDIASLYGARWEVELIFKELKSRYALDMIKTTNAMIVAALIWVALLTLLASRQIYNPVRRRAESSRQGGYSFHAPAMEHDFF
jgi:putative transposase